MGLKYVHWAMRSTSDPAAKKKPSGPARTKNCNTKARIQDSEGGLAKRRQPARPYHYHRPLLVTAQILVYSVAQVVQILINN